MRRTLILALAKVFIRAIGHFPLVQATPIHHLKANFLHTQDEPEAKPADDASLWLYLGVAAALVLLGGAFAGLTIALMGQVRIPQIARCTAISFTDSLFVG